MPSKATYSFTAPSASLSSDRSRQNQQESFYTPLPNPNQSTTPSSTAGSSNPSYNPYANPFESSRTPSPAQGNNPDRPLLADIRGTMPSSTSANNQRRAGPAAGMPPRGESQSTLLSSPSSQGKATRRYGPTASAAPIPATSSLLSGSATNSSTPSSLEGGTNKQGWTSMGMDPEADDYLHNPDPRRDRKNDRGGSIFTARGFMNIGCLALLLICLITLFAGYPIITYYTDNTLTTNGAYNLGGINETGQIPLIANFPTPVDPDTDSSLYTRTGFDGKQYTLVFSDEFNKDGRTFYDGDDPFWTAVDLHYWPTGDFEWYDPSAVTTKDGKLQITMTQEPIHDLNFKSGMLQSWNQLCFQYSFYIEVSVSLPGNNRVGGFWPGVWTMGNLGRPGYGASTDGMWPYTYDSCDIGTLKNQTYANGTGPAAALDTGTNSGSLSYLPGQRVSACTCPGQDHPGPATNYGRGVPEIDILEAQIDVANAKGQVSQSCQVAPFDDFYQFNNASTYVTQYNTEITQWNTYLGGVYQQAVSSLTYIDSNTYTGTSGQFNTYGIEVFSDPSNRGSGYITWVANGVQSWQMLPGAVGPNPRTGVGQRLIPEEPMAMVLNFGLSNNFQTVNFENLVWPATMLIDYVRVWQTSSGKMGCDPSDRPTANYIAAHADIYSDANLTTYADTSYPWPKNSLIDTC